MASLVTLGSTASDENHGSSESAAARCEHCDLPCAPSAKFCCFGCELVAGLVSRAGEHDATMRARAVLCAFFVMNLMAVTMVLYVDDVYPGAISRDMEPLRLIFRWAAAVFATPVMAILAVPMARSALRGASATRFVDALVLLSTGAAYSASLISLLRGDGPIYFEVAAMTLLLIYVGRSIEAVTKAKTAARIAESISPVSVRFQRRDADGSWHDIARHQIEPMDVVRVPAGSAVPIDGRAEGSQLVDRSGTTGEARAISLADGDPVNAGDIALAGALVVRATRPADASRMARLENATRTALAERGHFERISERLAAVLIPSAVVTAVLAFGYWYAHAGIDAAIYVSLAVLLCACPCAFGIATPLALRAGIARAGARGVRVRSSADVERLARASAVALDKTGTLTSKTIVAHDVDGDRPARTLAIAAALERGVEHPLADGLRAIDVERLDVSAIRLEPGCGVVGTLDGQPVGIGNVGLARALGVRDCELVAFEADCNVSGADGSAAACAHSGDNDDSANIDRLCVVEGDHIIGSLATAEHLRPDAHAAIKGLIRRGLSVRVLSGDSAVAVRRVADALAVPFEAGLTPETKRESLRRLQADAGSGTTLMVGDGVNDAPALAGAGLGVGIATGTDLARIVSPIIVSAEDLAALPWAIDLARAAMRTVRRNLAWAIAYNVACIAAASMGYLPPLLAAIAMALSSVGVAVGSGWLLRYPLDRNVASVDETRSPLPTTQLAFSGTRP